MKFYHGTTTAFQIDKWLYPPSLTGCLREDFRKVRLHLVYVTTSLYSAKQYANKAVSKFGGYPIVYQVKPYNLSNLQHIEYVCDKAKIINKIEV